MNKKSARRLLAVLLSLVMLFGLVPTALAAETQSGGVTWEQVDGSAAPDRFRQEAVTDPEETPLYADDEIVRVSIVLEAAPTIAVYSAEDDISENAAAMNYRQQLLWTQEYVAEAIAEEALDPGETLDVVYNLTLAANIISANVPYGEIEKIKAVEGVEDVVVATRYTPDVVSIGGDNPQMEVSSGMTGSSIAWSNGYTGAGMRIAIIDTGLDIKHQSFNSEAFDYAIAEDAKNDGVSAASYDLLDTAEIAEKLPQLHVSERMSSASADNLYISSKIPFGFNYVDRNLDVIHTNDDQGEHGSHVAGIAAANRYLKKDDGTFVSALQAVHMAGNAPDAQVLVMKVFGTGGGAYTDDYMAAIEDAIILGCDTVNLSLGGNSAGMAYDEDFSGMLESLSNSGTVVTISAGNSGAWAENTAIGDLYSDDVNFQTGGSPGSYTNSLGVASVDNDGIITPYFTVADEIYFYTEGGSAGNKPFVTLDPNGGSGTAHDYIFIDGFGEEDDYEALGELVKDKIVFCSRGEINFSAKAQNAFDNEAAACVVYNNTEGTISMSLSGYTGDTPCVSISQADAAQIKAASTEAATEGDYTYYTGTLTIVGEASVFEYDSTYQTMSSFSSWGVPGDLSIKPEITAPGGNIYSLFGQNKTETGAITGGHDQYELMSGTSMAAPQMAGIGALVKQAIEQRVLSQDGLSDRALAQSLLMSTATPLTDADGNYYSVMQQGAGMVSADAATAADSYVLVNGQNDGKVKVELGDDSAKTGTYRFTFTINNLDGEAHQYNLNADVFTQKPAMDQYLYMLGSTVSLDYSDISWTVDGVSADPAVDLSGYDFDGDGDTDIDDAQALLDYITGNRASISDKENADFDRDGDIDTYDVHLFLVSFTTGQMTVPANGSVTVTCTITLNDGEAKGLMDIYPNGFYVEAYAKITAVSDDEGVIGTSHSIPVLGFYGNWTDASMFDKGGYVEYSYDLESRNPYLYTDQTYNMNSNALLIQYAGDPSVYYFGANPYVEEEVYHPERISLNNERGDVLTAWRYSPIRNAAAGRITVTDANVTTEPLVSFDGSTAAYWNASQSKWENVSSNAPLNWNGTGLSEGDTVTLTLTLAPELYMDYEDGTVDWDALGKGASRSVRVTIDNTAPVVNSVTYNEEAGTLTVTASDNQYVAAVALFNQEGESLDATGSIADIKPGDNGEYTLSLAKAKEGAKNFMVQVYDYADNVSTWKLTLGETEPQEGVSSLTITPDAVTVLVGETFSVDLDYEPWSAIDTFTWVSSNEDVATVKDGVITGVAPGKATITAASGKDPSVNDICEVTVKTVDIDLNAIVWDADAVTHWSVINPTTLPGYTPMKDCGVQFDAATMAADGTIYATAMNNDASDAVFYKLDADLTATEVGDVGFGVADMADAPSLGYMLGLYGPYVLLIDKETGEFSSYFEWSADASLVGIAYYGSTLNTYYNKNIDMFLLVDGSGAVYLEAFMEMGGKYYYFNGPEDGLLGSTGYTAGDFYSSLTYAKDKDGTPYLFWSRFDGNGQDLIAIDVDSEIFKASRLGGFDSEIWPVVGLMTNVPALASGESTTAIAAALASAEAMPVELMTDLQPLGWTPAPRASAGGLNSIEVSGVSSSGYQLTVDTVNHTVTVPVLASDSTNGLYTVEYDPTVLTFQSATYGSVLHSAAAGVRGQVTVAYAAAEAYSGLVSNLVFSYSPSGRNRVTNVALNVKEDGTAKNTANVITTATLPAELAVDPPVPVTPGEPSEPTTPAGKSFDDVKPGDWFYSEVLDMAGNGYINGVSDRLFAPYQNLSRAMLVTILYRMDGEKAVSGSSAFTDVVKGSWYEKAVDWASANGIVTGYDATHFGPNDHVTRQQMAAILWRYAKYKGLDVAANGTVMPDFPDRGQIASWAGEAVSWAYSRGVMNGRNDGRLDPNGKATRAEAAVMLSRFLNLTPKGEKQ